MHGGTTQARSTSACASRYRRQGGRLFVSAVSTPLVATPIVGGISSRIPLPPLAEPAAEVMVSLETDAAPGSDTGHAWALFGEPRFEWKRPQAEVRASVRLFVQRLRNDGWRATFARLSHGRSAEEEAAESTQWVSTHTRSKPELEAHAAGIAALPIQPLISIITPVFNTDARWLRACIESVRRQTYPHWELCLCDDASSAPGPAEVFRGYASDPRVRVVRRADNAGISVASNAAAAIARGEFLALVDHDDELTPDALAEVVGWINAHPDAQVIYSDEDKLDLAGQRCDPAFKPDWSPDLFLHRMYTCHLMVVRKEVFESAGGFRTGYEGAQDYDLLLRVMERTDRIEPPPSDSLSLEKAAAINRQRRSGEAVGDGCRTAGAARITSHRARPRRRRCCQAAHRDCSG